MFKNNNTIIDLIEKRDNAFEKVCQLTNHLPSFINDFFVSHHRISLLEAHWITNVAQNNLFHQHEFLEIQIPYTGLGKVFTKKKAAHFYRGMFTLNSPMQEHNFEIIESPPAILTMWLLITSLRKEDCHENSKSINIVDSLLNSDDMVFELPALFYPAFDAIIGEIIKNNEVSSEIINRLFQALFLQMAETVYPYHSTEIKNKIVNIKKISGRMFISRIDEYLQSHLAKYISIDEIAQYFDIAPRTLTRRYSKQKGRTIWQSLNDMRMKHAKSLLKQSYLSIKEIALRCGFNDEHYFANRFKKYFDISPTSYRKKLP